MREELDGTLAGCGEHLYLNVRKIGATTPEVANRLARLFDVPASAVGYAGLKDRHAIAEQWFSIHTPREARVSSSGTLALGDGLEILDQNRHVRKLRRGNLSRNWFAILLRSDHDEMAPLVSRIPLLQRLETAGVPNYFGPQRFSGDNLARALEWLLVADPALPRRRRRQRPAVSPFVRGLYLSVARAMLFNDVLARRVALDNWRHLIDGDVQGASGEPTGPLWGRGRPGGRGTAGCIEIAVRDAHQRVALALEYSGARQTRRSLVLRPRALAAESTAAGTLLVRFALPPGGYATELLRNVFSVIDTRATGNLGVEA